jgi:hypothetical protein
MAYLDIYNDLYPYYIINNTGSTVDSINIPRYTPTPEHSYITGINYATATDTSCVWDTPSFSDYFYENNSRCNYDGNRVPFANYIISDSSYITLYKEGPIDKRRREIRSQLTIIVKSRVQEFGNVPENEKVAMQTLRDMITEAEFRKYVKYGFISVHGKSGKVYQVFRNRWHTKVFFQGELVEEICVRLKGDVPPTDNVIAFKTMIEADEESFASLGNRYNMREAA